MPRANWITDDNHPDLDAHVSQLEHFTKSLEDGVIDEHELKQQKENLAAAMRAVEAELSDAQHAKVTKVLAELAAYSVMQVLHDLAQARVRSAVK
jgi:hypothetical protein